MCAHTLWKITVLTYIGKQQIIVQRNRDVSTEAKTKHGGTLEAYIGIVILA